VIARALSYHLFLIAGMALSACWRAEAQTDPGKSPKVFYEHDYAVAPGYEGKDDTFKQQQISPRPSGETSFYGLVSSSPSTRGTGRGEPGRYRNQVVVLVNSVDVEHFERVIEEVLRLTHSRRGLVTGVYPIGNETDISTEVRGALRSRGVHIFRREEIPEHLNITVSPAWWIRTPEGGHLVEGVIGIEPLIDEYGEYDPKRAEEIKAGGKVEEF
jgi:hypothetical protein